MLYKGELPDNHAVICKKDTEILYKLHLFAENENGIVVSSVGGIQDNNNNWELIALYVDENVIGDTKFALSMVKEFAKRVKDAGSTIFTTGKLTGSRVCRLYELLGGKKIKEYINEKQKTHRLVHS